MKVGDLVRFRNNGMLGLIVKVTMAALARDADAVERRWYNIAWADGHTGNRLANELEVLNESR